PTRLALTTIEIVALPPTSSCPSAQLTPFATGPHVPTLEDADWNVRPEDRDSVRTTLVREDEPRFPMFRLKIRLPPRTAGRGDADTVIVTAELGLSFPSTKRDSTLCVICCAAGLS